MGCRTTKGGGEKVSILELTRMFTKDHLAAVKELRVGIEDAEKALAVLKMLVVVMVEAMMMLPWLRPKLIRHLMT